MPGSLEWLRFLNLLDSDFLWCFIPDEKVGTFTKRGNMKQYKLQDIRNIGFVGHGGSGKTSLAESVLYLTGVSERLGKTGDSSSIMDYDPGEIKRGHSINSSIAATVGNLKLKPGIPIGKVSSHEDHKSVDFFSDFISKIFLFKEILFKS